MAVDLVRTCIRTLKLYDGRLSPESHFELVRLEEPQMFANVNHSLVAEIFEGCVENKPVLRIVVDGFYGADGAGYLKSDRAIFEVMCYIAVFGSKHVDAKYVERMVNSMDLLRVSKFYRFLFDPNNLDTWIKDQLNTLYDAEYVTEFFLNPLRASGHIIRGCVDKMLTTSASVVTKGNGLIPPTVPQPFSLTALKPKSFPMPKPLPPAAAKHVPVPGTTYGTPLELQAQERKSNMRRDKAHKVQAAHIISASAAAPPAPAMPPKQAPFFARPAPANNGVQVKLNAAAVRREELVFRKEMEIDAKRLAALEVGGVDPEAFLVWEQTQRQTKEATEMAAIERRVLLGQLSREEAIIAHHQITAQRQKGAESMRATAAELLKRYVEEKKELEATNRKLVEDVSQLQVNVDAAKERLQQERLASRLEVQERNRKLLEEAEIVNAVERERRADLIRQIKAFESLPSARGAIVDLSESSGAGLMVEMSFVELQERLSLLRSKAAAAEQQRRELINDGRRGDQERIQQCVVTIQQARTEKQRVLLTTNAAKLDTLAVVKKATSCDPTLLALQDQLAKKKAERARVQVKA